MLLLTHLPCTGKQSSLRFTRWGQEWSISRNQSNGHVCGLLVRVLHCLHLCDKVKLQGSLDRGTPFTGKAIENCERLKQQTGDNTFPFYHTGA